MIAAERLRDCATPFDVLRALGYAVRPIAIDVGAWRRAGIDISWHSGDLHLATRTDSADVYVTDNLIDPESVIRFLRSLRAYNVIAKPVLICCASRQLIIYDLSPRRELRRLDVALDEPSPHALDRLNLLTCSDGADIARLFDRALDRDALTRQFFDRFRTSVHEVTAALRPQCRGERQDAIAAQALLILSRILFLYFVQQKGWLNGERRFLVDRLELAIEQRREFFATVLTPLFFGCLNTPRASRETSVRAFGAIPYLNGGLFEPSAFERKHADLHLPNELMQAIIERTFERFAFSIDETDSSGMHVDPEMLGKVFESLMAADERAASGSFYTPRAIVDVLVERAIGECDPERLRAIRILDPACGSGAFLLSALSALERRLPDVSRQTIIERCLYGVDLKAEAVRLCELRLWLAIVAKTNLAIDDVPPLPNLDRNILQGNSLLSPTDFLGNARADVYRDWLCAIRAHSDLVDRYRCAPQHERPALARLLRASDCRLATELLSAAIERDEAELHQLSIPQPTLFGDSHPIDIARCRELQHRIRDSARTLDRLEQGELDFFSFDVHFAHVMAAGRFDVVIGNPPWVRNSRIDMRSKRMYADRYPLFRGRNGNAFHQPDVSVVFFERSLSLASCTGVVSLLMPAKVMNAAYAAPLRRAAEGETIIALDDWSDRARHHFDADTFPLGITIKKGAAPRSAAAVHVAPGGEWSILPREVRDVIARLQREHPPLATTLGRTPVMGVKTGDNNSFFVAVTRVRGDNADTADGVSIPLRYLCRCVRGRDLRNGVIAEPAWMLWPPPAGWLRIPRWLERFAELRGIDPDDLRLSYVRPEHHGLKVVWKDVSRGVTPALLRREMNGVPLIPNQSLYALAASCVAEAQALAKVMRSTAFNALAVSIAERAKDFHYRYFGRTIARVPLPGAWRDENAYGLTRDEEALLDTYVKRRLGYAADDD